MSRRFVTIWFRYLKTDWLSRRQPSLLHTPFILAAPDHGRMLITAANIIAEKENIYPGMVVADARAILPGLQVFDDKPGLAAELLKAFAEWCIRFGPLVAVDLPDGLILDSTGCSHLWGGEAAYLTEINKRFYANGYHIRMAMADTIGTAWAVARFGKENRIIEPGGQLHALLSLPPEALRLEAGVIERLHKLGLRQVKQFITMPRSALHRRFGEHTILRIDQATGMKEEWLQPVHVVVPYQERLPCLEPIVTATGIEIALQKLLETLCNRLHKEGKGLRQARFICYRVDNKIITIEIGTNRASHHINHLFKLFEEKLSTIEPDLGIELFVLEAPKTEDLSPMQEKIWEGICSLENIRLAELIDRVANKIGATHIHRYLPDEHYWPERSIKQASSLEEKTNTAWRNDKPRPAHLLAAPEYIDVAAPLPDYPPMLFRYKGKLHIIKKADGPERIEREWWIEEGLHRDYYAVEDEEGHRYWIFRSGHYDQEKTHQWFIHGFFA